MSTKRIYTKEDLDKYANIIIRAFKKYMNMMEMDCCYRDVGLGKWCIIIDDNKTPEPQTFWLKNVIGVTGWKLWKEQRENLKGNYSITTTCLCIYCGINEKILSPEKQYNWILHIGKKLSINPYLKHISMRSDIYFKENKETREENYSFNSKNGSSKLLINIRKEGPGNEYAFIED